MEKREYMSGEGIKNCGGGGVWGRIEEILVFSQSVWLGVEKWMDEKFLLFN